MRPEQVQPLGVRVNLGVMAMKEYSTTLSLFRFYLKAFKMSNQKENCEMGAYQKNIFKGYFLHE